MLETAIAVVFPVWLTRSGFSHIWYNPAEAFFQTNFPSDCVWKYNRYGGGCSLTLSGWRAVVQRHHCSLLHISAAFELKTVSLSNLWFSVVSVSCSLIEISQYVLWTVDLEGSGANSGRAWKVKQWHAKAPEGESKPHIEKNRQDGENQSIMKAT